MNELWMGAARWLLHTAVGGGLLLLLTCLAMRWIKQPARRQRLGECGLTAALLVAVLSLIGPAWLVVAWNSPDATEPSGDREFVLAANTARDDDGDHVVLGPGLLPLPGDAPQPFPAVQDQPATSGMSLPAIDWTWMDAAMALVLAVFAVVAAGLGGRLVLGYMALARLLRRSEKAPPDVCRLFAAMAAGRRWVRLLVSWRLLVPLSCGLVRPTVVLPAGMCAPPTPQQLRWIFAHELTHLRRRDAWTALLFSMGQMLFFFVPWFWWLRRQVRLCQEYVADAAVTAGHAGQAVSYAEFLVSLANGPAVPAGAAAVSGHQSDLLRRVTMLLNNPLRVETDCSRRWTLGVAGALVSLAIVVAGLGYRAEAAADDPIVIVIHPGGDKAAGEKHKIRVFVAPVEAGKADAEDRVIVWRYAAPDDKQKPAGKDLKDLAVQIDSGVDFANRIVIEQIGPAEARWAYRFLQADDLEALRDAVKRLEALQKEGKLTKERIRSEVAKALAKMKVERIEPTLDKVRQLHLWHGKDDKGQPGKDVELMIEKHNQPGQQWRFQFDKDVPYDSVIKSLEELKKLQEGHRQGNWQFEFVPVDGQDKKTPQKVETVEQLKKLLGELEASHIKKHRMGEFYRALGHKEAAEFFGITQPAGVKPRLGVNVEALTPVLAEHLNLPANVGILVTEVMAQSPAEKVGIKVNDVLFKIDGAMVPSGVEDFVKLIAGLKSNTPFEVVVLRKGQKQSLGTVTLVDAPAPSREKAAKALSELTYEKAIKGALEHLAQMELSKKSEEKDTVTTTVTRRGDTFAVKHQESSSTITLNATLKDGKLHVDGISVHDAKGVQNYQTLNEAPEPVRSRVQQILKMLARSAGTKDAK
jgi:beta-lactamase regulating signal transducer with metallopeptidase domain